MKKRVPGCLGEIGDNTTQFYRDYNTPLWGSRLTNQYNGSIRGFFDRGSDDDGSGLCHGFRLTVNASSASGPTRKKSIHNLFDASKNLMLSRQFIATFPAGWSPQKVVKSKGIRSPKWPKDSGQGFVINWLGGGFKDFLFSPLPGEMIQFDEHIFQMGWFNHQLVDQMLFVENSLMVELFKVYPSR